MALKAKPFGGMVVGSGASQYGSFGWRSNGFSSAVLGATSIYPKHCKCYFWDSLGPNDLGSLDQELSRHSPASSMARIFTMASLLCVVVARKNSRGVENNLCAAFSRGSILKFLWIF